MRESDCEMKLVWTGDSCHYRFIIEKNLYESAKRTIESCLSDRKETTKDDKIMLDFRV